MSDPNEMAPVRPAPDVKEIADILVRPTVSQEQEWPNCAGVHQRLESLPIIYAYLRDTPMRKSRVVMARTERLTDKHKILGYKLSPWAPAFLLLVSGPVWDELDMAARLALIDHELCHIGGPDEGFPLVGHDLEEFRVVVDRHGVGWDEGLQDFAASCVKASGQPELPLFGGAKDGQGYQVPAMTEELREAAQSLVDMGVRVEVGRP